MAKMAKNNPSITSSKVNFDLLCNINLLISLSSLLPMLKIVHALIKFAQTRMYLYVDMLQPSRSSKVNYTFTMWIQKQNMPPTFSKTSKVSLLIIITLCI